MDVCLRVSCPGYIPDPELLTAGVNLPELELETLNIRKRMRCVECTDSLLASKCNLDETEYDLIAFRVIHLSPFIMMERDVTHMNL